MAPTSGAFRHISADREDDPESSTALNHVFVHRDKADRSSRQEQLPLKSKPASASLPDSLSQTPSLTQNSGDSINSGLHPTHAIGKYIALDCEMVGAGPPPHSDHVLARVSAVNYHGDQIYDAYVLPPPGIEITDYRTWVSGIQPHHLRPGFARPFEEVRAEVAALLEGKILVGHALRNDLQVLQLSHPRRDMRDTAQYPKFRKGSFGSPALRHLAKVFLGLDIQTGEHSSLEDARATMSLFRQERAGFEVEVRKRHGEPDRQQKLVARPERKAGAVKSITEAVTATAKRNDSYDPNDLETWEGSELEANGLEPVVQIKKKRKKKKRTKRK
jgi:RNA exonuclease 4